MALYATATAFNPEWEFLIETGEVDISQLPEFPFKINLKTSTGYNSSGCPIVKIAGDIDTWGTNWFIFKKKE